jgi:hypothetical protein
MFRLKKALGNKEKNPQIIYVSTRNLEIVFYSEKYANKKWKSPKFEMFLSDR